MGHQPARAAAARPRVIRAAGVIPWRRTADGRLEVALVHRPAYDDWSWAKGKLEPGEDWATAAARETREETGLQVRLGPPLPTSEYPLPKGNGRAVVKQVRYWAGTVIGGSGALEHEIDEVIWLPLERARDRLSYPRDREQLAAVAAANLTLRLETWPLLIIRHAHAVARGNWSKPDPDRPLSTVGLRRAKRLVPLLTAYAPTRVLTSPSARCADTVAPYGKRVAAKILTKAGLSEEGYAEAPDRARRHLGRLLERGEAAALCSHRPLLPGLLEQLARHTVRPLEAETLHRLARIGMDKGEVLACTMVGTGPDATVIAVTRHRPPA